MVLISDFEIKLTTAVGSRTGSRLAIFFALAFMAGCGSGSDSEPSEPTLQSKNSQSEKQEQRTTSSRIAEGINLDAAPTSNVLHSTHFTTVSPQCGIDFTYQNGASGKLLMVEATGGGGGWLDYDCDGRSDLYLVQGGDPTQPASLSQPSDCLFRNVGDEQFEDVTAAIGIDERMYGQGIAVGDYDNDGFDDIFVTNVGKDSLYHNEGDGTFTKQTSTAVSAESQWSSSAAWTDIDRDGDLDLYVGRYVDFDPFDPKLCISKSGEPGTCHPKEIAPIPDAFFLNQGDGTFLPAARQLGLFGPGNRALGIVIADFNNDGWSDIYVANDTTDNFLFMNENGQEFHDMARIFGGAVNSNGSPQASMGVAVGDYDGNGFLDLYLTHFHEEWNTLLQNLGPSGFQDVTAAVGLSVPTMQKLAFGAVMQDFDHNGWVDLLVANGHIDNLHSEDIEYEMNPQLFAFNGKTWEDRSGLAGDFFEKRVLGRAIATADFDNDGDLDAVLIPQNSPTAILRNDSERGHWLNLRFIGRTSNRQGIGARVSIRCGGRTFMQELVGGSSYCASNQPILSLGFGECSGPYELEVRWPNGIHQIVPDVAADQLFVLQEPDRKAP